MTDGIDKIVGIMVTIIIGVAIVGIFAVIINSNVKSEFCQDNHMTESPYRAYSGKAMKDGYIECCVKNNCKVYKYED